MLTAQERNTIKRQIQANRHEVFIVSLEQMDAVIKSSAGDKGQDVKQHWQQIKSKAELAAQAANKATASVLDSVLESARQVLSIAQSTISGNTSPKRRG